MYKVTLILDKFFLKYEGEGGNQIEPLEKTTLTKSSIIRVKPYHLLHGSHTNRFKYKYYSVEFTFASRQNYLNKFLNATDITYFLKRATGLEILVFIKVVSLICISCHPLKVSFRCASTLIITSRLILKLII